MSETNKNYNKKAWLKILRIVLLIILFPIVIIYAVCNFFVKRKNARKNKDKISMFAVSQLDTLSGVEFEEFLKDFFEKQGYNASLTKTTGDFGADLILTKKGKTSIVQAKCYQKTVGIKAIQEIIGAKKHYGSDMAIVATNNYFSKQATMLAKENDVRLIDRDVIAKLMREFSVDFKRTRFSFSAINSNAISEIESKYRFWI